MPESHVGLVGLLLAAGRGRRFDAAGRRNKLLAELPDGQTVIATSARAMCAAMAKVFVVVPMRAASLEAALLEVPVRLVRNARAGEGMGASIAVGIEAIENAFPDAAGWVVSLGDMPFIAPATIARVADALLGLQLCPLDNIGSVRSLGDTAPVIAMPAYRGRRGHPVAFSSALGGELRALGGDVGASVLFERHAVRIVECEDRGILRDVDTSADLGAVGSAPRISAHD